MAESQSPEIRFKDITLPEYPKADNPARSLLQTVNLLEAVPPNWSFCATWYTGAPHKRGGVSIPQISFYYRGDSNLGIVYHFTLNGLVKQSHYAGNKQVVEEFDMGLFKEHPIKYMLDDILGTSGNLSVREGQRIRAILAVDSFREGETFMKMMKNSPIYLSEAMGCYEKDEPQTVAGLIPILFTGFDHALVGIRGKITLYSRDVPPGLIEQIKQSGSREVTLEELASQRDRILRAVAQKGKIITPAELRRMRGEEAQQN